MRFHRVGRDSLLVMVSRDDPLATRGCVSIRELDGRTFILYAGQHDISDQLNSLCAACGTYPARTFFAKSELEVPFLVRSETAVALVTAEFAAEGHEGVCSLGITEGFSLELCWAYKESNANRALPAFVKLATELIKRDERLRGQAAS